MVLARNLLIFLSIIPIWICAQNTYTISGYVRDAGSGESLFGANIFNSQNPTDGVSTNQYGFYSLSLKEGTYNISYSYLGFTNQEIEVQLTDNHRLNVELFEGVTMDEIIVTAEDEQRNVSTTEMGTVELPMEDIKKLPALLGEIDILKTLQLLPGVQSAGEGNAGFYVRGGGPDQNLVLLDEAVVYNSGHMLGFFSVFNADAIKNTTLIKGTIPANYGGRLSSVVDIQMKEGNDKAYELEGGIGIISSRMTIEGPIVKKHSSFMVSARRTYALDLAQPIINKTNAKGTNYYFYDLNTKINYRFSDKDRLYLSVYFGRDVFIYNSEVRGIKFKMPYGNATATLRWNHLFSDKLFMNASAIINNYDFSFGGEQDQFTVDVFSGVRDYNFKLDFDYYPAPAHHLKMGLNTTHHRLTPNIASATSGDVAFETDLRPKYALESAIYLQDDYKVSDHLSLQLGLRASLFNQIGPYISSIDSTAFGNFEPVISFFAIEPRLSGKFSLSPSSSIKAGLSRGKQYLHLVSNSTSTLPTDVWVPSSEKVKPQQVTQYAIGYFQNFKDNSYEAAIEFYYKKMQHQIDYTETYVNDPATEVEEDFVFGRGRSFGMELFFKKRKGRLNGWIGYTLSKTDRQFNDINNGNRFPATYDRRHDLSVVLNFELNKRWQFGAVFIYGTGNTFTPVKSLYFIEQELNVAYGNRNSARLEPYHRIDLAATLTPSKQLGKAFKSSWTFSIYNVYSRLNPLFFYYDLKVDTVDGSAEAKAYKISLFPLIPSVSWNFKWKQKKKGVD